MSDKPTRPSQDVAKCRKCEHRPPAGRAGCSSKIQFLGRTVLRPSKQLARRAGIAEASASSPATWVGSGGCRAQLTHRQLATGAAELAEDLGPGSANVCTAAGSARNLHGYNVTPCATEEILATICCRDCTSNLPTLPRPSSAESYRCTPRRSPPAWSRSRTASTSS